MNAQTLVGQPLDRTDGVAKITGKATYASEFKPAHPAYALLIQSVIPNGRIRHIETQVAQSMPGVITILTHTNAPKLPDGGRGAINPPAGRVLSLLQDDVVHYNGEPIAVVVAESLEYAQDAARVVQVSYDQSPAVLDFDLAKGRAHAPDSILGEKPDSHRGSVEDGAASAAVRIEQIYTTPMEFHNPMEPHATVAQWHGDKLTLYDATQYVSGVKETVAKVLGIPQENIRVVCLYTGGGFGCKGSVWSHVVLAAVAARVIKRPVKLVLARPQMFGPVGGRPKTEQKIMLASDASGRLTAIRHDVLSTTSMIEDWTEPSAMLTRMLYSCPNVSTRHRLVRPNTGTPTFMRAPGEASGSFALEVAMDELAYRLGIDPVALRLQNYAERDEDKDKPFSSKSLRECYRVAADRFNWSRRTPAPRSMKKGHERVGLGMATASYPAHRGKAAALARLNADGTVLVRSGSQELGTGTYTVMTQVAADAVGFPLRLVHFELGDTDFPRAPVSGGSQTAASVSPAVEAAARGLRDRLIDLAIADPASPLYQTPRADVTVKEGWLMRRDDGSRRDSCAALVGRTGGQPVEVRAQAQPGSEKENYSSHSFGAVFVELHVDEDLGTVRMQNVVASYGVGRLLNAKTAHSQLAGGIVWGIGMALLESGQLDGRYGRIVNNNLAEYHVPANADVGNIEVIVVDEKDTIFNPLGVKGIGEIGITGVAGAIANAVYHATGRRVRDLPITLDRLI